MNLALVQEGDRPMARMKGTVLASSVAYLKSKLGEEGFRRLAETLPEEDREALDRPILVGNWYRFGLLVDLMTAAEGKVRLSGGHSLPWEMGRYSAEAGLKGIYRLFFKVAETGFILKRATQLFSAYYDSGTMQVVVSEPKLAVIRIVGFEEPGELFCQRVQGWCQRTTELAGHKNVVLSHPRCAAKGDPFCEFKGTWD